MQRCSTFLGRSVPVIKRAETDRDILDRAQPRRQRQGPHQEDQPKKEWTPWGYETKQPLPDLPDARDLQPDRAPPPPEPAPEAQPAAPRRIPKFHMYDDLNLQQQPAKARKRPAEDLESQGDARPQPRRLGRSVYDALQTHGHFGLVDGGETFSGGVRRIVVHVPKRSRGYALDIKQGEVIYANSARGKPVGGRLDVLYVSRHRYVPPGHAVTSCVIGVPEHQWSRFVD